MDSVNLESANRPVASIYPFPLPAFPPLPALIVLSVLPSIVQRPWLERACSEQPVASARLADVGRWMFDVRRQASWASGSTTDRLNLESALRLFASACPHPFRNPHSAIRISPPGFGLERPGLNRSRKSWRAIGSVAMPPNCEFRIAGCGFYVPQSAIRNPHFLPSCVRTSTIPQRFISVFRTFS